MDGAVGVFELGHDGGGWEEGKEQRGLSMKPLLGSERKSLYGAVMRSQLWMLRQHWGAGSWETARHRLHSFTIFPRPALNRLHGN